MERLITHSLTTDRAGEMLKYVSIAFKGPVEWPFHREGGKEMSQFKKSWVQYGTKNLVNGTKFEWRIFYDEKNGGQRYKTMTGLFLQRF